jgi:hypothetical protein
VTVPKQEPPLVKVDSSQQHIHAPAGPVTKHVRAWRDPKTGEMRGEVSYSGDATAVVEPLAKALRRRE